MPSAPTLDRMQVRLFQTGLGGKDFTFTRASDGTATVEGLKVFKAGTFRDSMGIQSTWEIEHLSQMVFHFDMLRERGVLPNVPVRADHSFSVDKVVGYVDALVVDGGFLRSNFQFTEPDAADKFERGTYRNRSAEIGLYETNDEAFYWPVFTGFAFVDLSAVEGLYAAPEKKYTLITDKETPVPGENPQQNGGATQTTTAPPAAQTPAAAPAAPPAPAGLFARATPGAAEQPIHFTIAGQQTTDPVAVQSHITVLETFRSETGRAAREAYVKALASDGKIAATQIAEQTAFVASLNDEQFAAFTKSWDAAPKSALFEKHGNPSSNTDGKNGTTEPGTPTEIEQLREVVAMHRRSKTPGLENLASFKKLQALEAANQAKA